jgi:hypothetical protein
VSSPRPRASDEQWGRSRQVEELMTWRAKRDVKELVVVTREEDEAWGHVLTLKHE